MANSDKVIQAIFLARAVRRIDDVAFSLVQQNGFFLQIGGERIMEFQTFSDGTIAVSSLNTAIQPVLNNIRSQYEARIGSIIA